MNVKPNRKERMAEKLISALAPEVLDIIDESEKHHGHGGWKEGGETHYKVLIEASVFTGKSRVERHRMVNAALAEELAGGLHALALVTRAPGEG